MKCLHVCRVPRDACQRAIISARNPLCFPVGINDRLVSEEPANSVAGVKVRAAGNSYPLLPSRRGCTRPGMSVLLVIDVLYGGDNLDGSSRRMKMASS